MKCGIIDIDVHLGRREKENYYYYEPICTAGLSNHNTTRVLLLLQEAGSIDMQAGR